MEEATMGTMEIKEILLVETKVLKIVNRCK